MTRSSGSIQRKLRWGFTAGAMAITAVVTGVLYWTTLSHLESGAGRRATQQAGLIRQLLSRHSLQEVAETVDAGWIWSTWDPSGMPRYLSPPTRDLPLSLSWPEPHQAPVVVETEDRLLTLVSVPWSGTQGYGTLRLALDRTGDLALRSRMRWASLLAVLGTGGLALVLGHGLARRSLAPLGSITRETGSIDYRHLDVRLREEDFPEEFGLLVKTLNASLRRLQTAFERLGRLGAELAHELRTPLQNLRVGLEDLLLRPRDLEATRDGIGAALEEIARMASLIDQVLLLARSEHPGAAISARELDLEALLEAITEPFQLSAEEKEVNIRVQVMEGIHLVADEGLLRRAVGNLLANALRHAPVGGWIVVGAFMAGREVRIWVEDNGPGIPPELVDKLGTPFERGPRAEAGGGFGLGLAIVNGIMNLHGGRMALESTMGHGTKVSLSFPRPA